MHPPRVRPLYAHVQGFNKKRVPQARAMLEESARLLCLSVASLSFFFSISSQASVTHFPLWVTGWLSLANDIGVIWHPLKSVLQDQIMKEQQQDTSDEVTVTTLLKEESFCEISEVLWHDPFYSTELLLWTPHTPLYHAMPRKGYHKA